MPKNADGIAMDMCVALMDHERKEFSKALHIYRVLDSYFVISRKAQSSDFADEGV